MTRRRALQQHRQMLDELGEIMSSMKTLAFMETRKLGRFLEAQQAVVRSIETIAADFLGFHADTLPASGPGTGVYVLIGSERGFCGDFNHALVSKLDAILEAQPAQQPLLVSVGNRLGALFQDDPRVHSRIEGASIVEEVATVLNLLVRELLALQRQHGTLNLYALYHRGADGIELQTLLPPFQQFLQAAPQHAHPPLLNLPPRDFLVQLTDHYLLAALNEMMYASLMAENQQRMAHLEGATRHLGDESAELLRHCNALRQEEIIEEIEVILLSAESLQPRRKAQSAATAPAPE